MNQGSVVAEPSSDSLEFCENNGILQVLPYQTQDFIGAKRGLKHFCYCLTKRLFDVTFSGIFIIAFSWLYLIIGLLVKISDGGSVFYKHERVGVGGKTIYISKFRSMRKGADNLVTTLSDEQRREYTREYKVADDPRITKLGRFLRRTSLDELPNMFSVFTGKLSFVGPRPLMREELVSKYGDNARKLLSVKPGITGWWAVNGRNNRTYESGERQNLELYYVERCSVWLDLKILFKTVVSVFRCNGAK